MLLQPDISLEISQLVNFQIELLGFSSYRQIGGFQGPQTLQIGEFMALKFSRLESFRALKCLSLPDLVNEPCEARYIIHVPENLFKLFSFFLIMYQQPIRCLGP